MSAAAAVGTRAAPVLFAGAQALGDECVPVFPCNATKAPLTPNGYKDATAYPDAADYIHASLVGMPTGAASGIDVVDVDPRHGGDVWLAENAHRLPVTRMQRTRSGGWHIYFHARADTRCSASRIAPGVDVRAEGGYIIRWDISGLPVEHPDDLAPWPEWLADAARGSRVRHADNPARSVADLAAPSGAAVIGLLDRMPNPPSASRDDYVRVMLAAKGCYDAESDDVAADGIVKAALQWACRWISSPGYEAEAEKWEADWATREAPLAGWQNLLAAAQRFGVDTTAERAEGANEFGTVLATVAAPVVTYLDPVLLEFTEDAAALGVAERFAGRFVFDHTNRQWFEFSPAVGWEQDDNNSVFRTIRRFVREARRHWGEKQSEGAAKIAFSANVLRASESDEQFAVTARIWDEDPYILGVPGGSVDLRTGEFQAADPRHFVLRRTRVAPDPPGSRPDTWLAFLHDATGGDRSLQDWLQRLLGYALTGDVSEEMAAFFYGAGGNGKGVLINTVSSIAGAYAYQAPAELFKADSRTNREYQIAKLDGVRLLLASETEAGSDLAESFVKEITGNEGKLNGRHPHCRPFEFKPQMKLVLVGNHAPKLNGRSPAMERRLRVVPFNRRPPVPDTTLKDRLVAEYPAILRWLIDGCLAWQRDGLGTAAAIDEASVTYFSAQDSLADWIAERCDQGSDMQIGAAILLASYNSFLQGRGERAIDARAFKETVCRVDGVTAKHTNKGNVFCGLKLRLGGQNDDR